MTLRLPHELRTIIIFYFFSRVPSRTFVKSQWSPHRESRYRELFFSFRDSKLSLAIASLAGMTFELFNELKRVSINSPARSALANVAVTRPFICRGFDFLLSAARLMTWNGKRT
jgi:hypothetical protein